MTGIDHQMLALGGGDPFDQVRRRSERHQQDHGCGLHPASGLVMQCVAGIARAANARRIVDLGCGIGYSTLWLAQAAGPDGHVVGIDDDPNHVAAAREVAAEYGLGSQVRFVVGRVTDVLPTLTTVDLVHDDAWFAREPDHLEAAVSLLRPGGVLTMANWFLLVDALSGTARNDWTSFAGPGWAKDTIAYAHTLAARPDLSMHWIESPPLGFAVRS